MVIEIVIFILIAIIIVCVIKKLKDILEYIDKNRIIKKIIQFISNVTIFSVSILLIYSQICDIKYNINYYISEVENNKVFNYYDEKMLQEYKFYQEAVKNEYKNQKPKEPYIPEGFQYVEGNWDSGFVIQDDDENQYVWVPCTNKENSEITQLQTKHFSRGHLINKYDCSNENYEKFLKSALENGGFYISRFEIGKENDKIVSKANVKIWSDITQNKANNNVNKMYENINCELINGYAYDTTLLWLINSNKVESNNVDINQEILTGRKSYNNIYDFFDNVMEITSEISYDTVIIRGFPDNMELTESFDRFSILKEETSFNDKNILGFRTIIYK